MKMEHEVILKLVDHMDMWIYFRRIEEKRRFQTIVGIGRIRIAN